MKNCASSELLLSKPSLPSDIDRELAERNLRDFVRSAWAVVEPSTPFVEGWHIDAITEHLQAITRGEIRNLLINVPPRHMKSLLVSVFWPCWEWLRCPQRRWLFSSYAATLSIRDSVKCRRLIDSLWYQANWSDRFALTGDQNAKARFENDRSGYRLSTSVGGTVTGEGGDRVICDDPHSVQEAESDTVRMNTVDWWNMVMSTRLNDPRTAAKVIVMQRCHQQDLSGHVLEQGGWEYLCLPAEYEVNGRVTSIGWSDPRTEPGELLWPERFGVKEIEDLKRSLGSYGAAGQLQQRPAPSGGGIIKKHWWRYWQPPDAKLAPVPVRQFDGSLQLVEAVVLPEKFDQQAQSWDCAFKDLGTSDFVAGQVWAAKRADRYLLDYVQKRLDLPGTVAAVKAMSEKWPGTNAKYIEDKANGPAVIQSLKHAISGLIAVNPEGGKIARANAVSPQIESGNVYLPHPSLFPWVEGFIESCAAFPNGAYDDDVDAATQALYKMRNSALASFPPLVSLTKPNYWKCGEGSS
jgi:predicted phage terminase large subunit-like protein